MQFYSEVSNALGADSSLWSTEVGVVGLYPKVHVTTMSGFTLLGHLVARAIIDERRLDISINEIFVDRLLGRFHPPSLKTLERVDPMLARSLRGLAMEEISRSAFDGLYFVHPSLPDIELCSTGASKAVNPDNFDEYRDLLLKLILETALNAPVAAFQAAFNQVLPLSEFSIMCASEFLQLVNGISSWDWKIEGILSSIKADHGYTKEDMQVIWLAQVLEEMTIEEKKALVKFVTGSGSLPTGGWSGLHPQFTVVLRPEGSPDNSLPSVMTCTNYIKLPRYTCKEVLHRQLLTAIKEGQGSFLLS